MAYSKDQNEPKVPVSNVEKRTTSDLLPRFYRTKGNKKFLQATLDQLTQPGTVKKLNGFIGRKTAKAVSSTDIFLEAPSKEREDYQFEPGAVIQDYLGNTTFFKDYIDHINHLSVADGIVSNHSRLNKQEFYSWNPHIDWDKFVNYQQYYWLPFGPPAINVLGQQLEIQSTFTVKGVDEEDNVAYLFTPNGLTRNPTLRLFRGQTYKFDVDVPGHPFSIKTDRTGGSLDRFNNGVSQNGIEKGEITFTVPSDCPDVLFYVSENAVDTGGVFQVLDIEENTAISVDIDVLGKKEYIVPNGTSKGLAFSNGMKVSFGGQVTPQEYGEGYWYVEGVGTAIKLISDRDLEVKTSYNIETNILFDDTPFDQLPFGDASTLPGKKDYITINRASVDRNPWSRYNRWFHKSVIEISGQANGVEVDLDQTARATRPIIEFSAGLKLYNFGIQNKKPVDVIDTFTKDVFSTVEGSFGYNVDGIDLADGMRILFNADTDSLVRNKIYKVNFISVTPPSRQITFVPEFAVNPADDTITFDQEHGLSNGNKVTYLENGNNPIPGLVNRQVYFVKVVDRFIIELHTVNSLTKKVDIFGLQSGTHKLEVFTRAQRQIYLTEEPDTVPQLYETVTVNYGTNEILPNNVKGNQGQTYWFNGTTWKLAQQKYKVNQQPLFDVFDSEKNSYSDPTYYDGTTFTGTEIFSYKVGNGFADTELKFPLSYLNINNVGDIVFEFDLLTDKFSYKIETDLFSKNTDVGYLMIAEDLERIHYENGWTKTLINNSQPVVRVFKESGLTNDFPIDVFEDKEDLEDLEVRVYKNGKRLAKDSYTIEDGVVRKFIRLDTDISETDVLTLRCFAKQEKNENGYYELPINLQNNPLNDNVVQFTLGQVIDHVDTIIDNINLFEGTYPGTGNLRDIGNLSAFGTRFVQHSGPLNLSLYHLGSKSSNIIKALDKAREDYGKFKRSFLIAANESGIDTDPRRHVDFILQRLVKDKPKTGSYYLSDMFGYTASNRLEYTVLDSRIKTYPLTNKFNLDSLSNKSVIIYLNGEQLLFGKDYVFGDDVFFEILRDIQEDDLIEAYEYDSTDGCFCPATPTKLGLYPKFEPKKYLDDTYREPVEVIQGHDGSITIAFGDFRDELILELEKRIFNNIKTHYDTNIFDIFDFVPGYNRTLDYTREEFDRIASKYFYRWTANIQEDFTQNSYYDFADTFTYNYRGNYTSDEKDVPAAWRGIYRWLLDTDRPHTHPWECIGFSIEPSWWQEVYGPAPYTSDNLILWEDISQGVIREPGVPVRRNTKFAKPILNDAVPVDQEGKLLSPKDCGIVQGFIRPGEGGFYVFGDQGPVETAWRRSSYYPYALLETCLLMRPNDVLGRTLVRSSMERNLNDQLVYKETGLRLRLADILLPSTFNTNNEVRIYTNGLINYIIDYLSSENTDRIEEYQTDLKSLTNKISTRLGAFTSQPKFKLLLDSKTPSSSGGVFVPEENYNVALNTSSAIKKIVYSGVVITKFADGFEIRGYNFDNPYFIHYGFRRDLRVIKVGGISESFINWNPGQTYVAGKLIRYSNQYYRVKNTHNSGQNFDSQYYARLAELPIVGGREAILRDSFNPEEQYILSYGTKLSSIQEVVDFLQGYGAYLEDQGFVFDDFNNNLGAVSNWETSVKEFMFWTTQGWGIGSVLSLSPAANKLIFRSNIAMVDDITDQFYGYRIFRVDGQKLDPEFITAFRSNGEFVIEPESTAYGIYGATLHLVQKEHIVLIDNTTLFNDTIFDPPAGYKQDRVKVIGYVTSDWKGSFEIPGFIYDQAVIKSWEPWTDYKLGDIVKHKEFYYSAKTFLVGTAEFNSNNWILLEDKPTPELLPNWDYKSEQFTDFYDLDTDNFDSNQQKIAQHLIGYQKRQYLENIIKNDVSQYKFYQGMIIEKGTQNVLNKLFDVLSADGQESLTFDEEWAFRVGEYGAIDTFDEIEFLLDESQFKINPQPLEVVDFIDPDVTDFVYRQLPSDIYIKPLVYSDDLWPSTVLKRYLKNPGYVRKEDVKLNIDSINDLPSRDISDFREGDYIWAAFEGQDWNVYRFNKTLWKIEDVSYNKPTEVVTVTCDRTTGLAVGNIIGIENSDLLRGFHKIISSNSNTFTFKHKIAGWTEFEDKNTILSYDLTSQRVSNVDEANSVIPQRIKNKEIFWADDNGDGYWTVYENTGVYRKSKIFNSNPAADANFGKTTAIVEDGNTCAVYDDSNGISLYRKASSNNSWELFQRIFDITAQEPLLRFSKDGLWLFFADASAESGRGTVIIYKRLSNGQYVQNNSYQGAVAERLGFNLSVGKRPNPTKVYPSLSGQYAGQGSGALWNVVRTGSLYSVIVTSRGIEYNVGEKITIKGSDLDGDDEVNDLVLTISAVDISTGSILSFTQAGLGLSDAYMLAITAQTSGKVYTYKYTESLGWQPMTTIIGVALDQHGFDLAVSGNGNYMVISSPTGNGYAKIYSYDQDLDQFTLLQTLSLDQGPDDDDLESFGYSVALSNTGEYLAVSCYLLNIDKKKDVGQIKIYRRTTSLYQLYQSINSLNKEVNERFAIDIEFMNDDETLVVFSKNGDITNVSNFDDGLTTFDNDSMKLVDVEKDLGRIDVFDRYNTKYIYGESLENSSSLFKGYGEEISVGANTILVSVAQEDDQTVSKAGIVYSYVKPSGTYSWSAKHQQGDSVDISKIKKLFLYDKSTNKLVTYLDVIDPIQGKIAGIADQEIKYKTFFDPAIYVQGTSVVNVDEGMAWGSKQVGMLWWDLSNAKFLDTTSGDIVYKSSAWNRLYDTGNIDVYEWVESSLLPSAWNKAADTETGLAKGVSGTSKYDDSVYSVVKKYDSISKTFKETYYFWVKNKKIIPKKEGRTLSADNIASLIRDPIGYGYPFIAFTGTNSITFCNIRKYLKSKDIVLNIQYWLGDVRTSNYHSQWKLLSTNRNTVIPTVLETKWIDSLVGKDFSDRVVPDLTLPPKLRYGIEFRPRQSMFVNRIEALKQVIERVNNTLKNKLIADDYDLSDLNKFEPLPSTVSGLWDVQIDTDAELRFVPTILLQTPSLTPIIEDGRIVGVNILRSGYGYGKLRVYQVDPDNDPLSWYGPKIKVAGSGRGAILHSILNSQGSIIDVIIENSGEGYDLQTILSVRDFSVLVTSDSFALGNWSIYSWSTGLRQWQRIRSQNYDVRKYWKYIDWYEVGYSQFNKIDHLVENTYELVTTSIDIGEVAKVRNVGTGGWLLLEKYDNKNTIDFTQNFKVIGRQNGTIQFLPILYQYQASVLGYDGPLYDAAIFDNSPSKELRIILDTIKDKILVDELRIDYLKLFFASVMYVLQEQTFVDWVFKTSFVKSMHNVGELKQKVTYNNDNLEYFEQYISEVKPYRTKVREYVSNYGSIDNTQTAVTDFDLLPVIDETLKVSPLTVYVQNNGQLQSNYDELFTYPWKYWTDNIGFEITQLLVIAVGRDYVTPPVVEITGPQLPWGTPAEAKAYITKGQILRIDLINPGSGWIDVPKVTLKGGLLPTGRAAAVVAQIGNSPVRTNIIKMKFDRVSKNYELDVLTQIETFTGTGTRANWPLRWSPDLQKNNVYVSIDGIEQLKDSYSVSEVELGRASAISRGLTTYTGRINFKVAPPRGSVITVEYTKSFRHLSATDRINFYYDPESGQIGKDLAQLMKGVDYGGVQIVGLDFGVNIGWDSLPWFTEAWDTVDPTFEDFIVTVSSPVPSSFRMPYVPADGQEINIYISRYDVSTDSYLSAVRIDDPNYLTIYQTNQNALMTSFVGDGEVDIIYLPDDADLQVNDRVIFRKDTSDGSYAPRDDDYDTKLSGGDLTYSSATGISPDDIILDGDDFVSPTSSHAPEEVVPGQVMDTVAIKVYHRPSGGCPNILFNTYRGNGDDDTFVIGQYFLNDDSIIVKVDNSVVTTYTIDYENNRVVFNTPPANGAVITILTVGLNAANVLDLDYFVADGTTTEYITKAPWLPTVTSTVIVNGENLDYVLFSTDDTYTDLVGQTWRSKVGIRFENPPPAGALINYIIDNSGATQTASIAKSETVVHNGTDSTYQLLNQVGISDPLEQNVLVKTSTNILRPASAFYFTMSDDNLFYALEDHKTAEIVVDAGDIKVYRNTELLNVGSDYSIEFDTVGPSYAIDESSILITAGSGYSLGEVVELVGGSLGPTGSVAKFEITQLTPTGGGIRRLEAINPGSYTVPPSGTISLVGGSGTGATITAEFVIAVNNPNIAIQIRETSYVEGSKLTVIVKSRAQYFIDNNEITFVDTWPANTTFEILSFYNHNVLGIERTVDELIPVTSTVPGTLDYYNLSGKLGGRFTLRNSITSGNFVWIIKNGQLLMHGVDYILEEDYRTVKLKDYLYSSDEVQLIAFTNTVVHDSFAYMQFKDMLNRTHYKRLNIEKTTRLAKDLNQYDRDIYLEDASNFDDPTPSKNVPGVIEINGERIEYLVKVGNVLSQITRGTLGTGVPLYHAKGNLVLGIGASETIPYKDHFTLVTHVSDGISDTIDLPYIPSINDIEVFVGGYRMKKNDYVMYDISNGFPESPFVKITDSAAVGTKKEGDTKLAAEFYVTGRSELRLLQVPPMGVKVVVIKKQGKLWNDMGVRLAKSNNLVANFLKDTKAPWQEIDLDKYEERRVVTPTGTPLQTGDGEPLEY